MSIEDFKGKKHINISQLARDLDYSKQHVIAVLNGRLRAGRKLIKLLVQASDGKLTPEDLLNAYKDRQEQK